MRETSVSKEDENLVDHISDKRIQLLYVNLYRDDYVVLEDGEKLIGEVDDKLAVLEAMKVAAQDAVDDFEEHGNENQAWTWGDKPKSYFVEKLKSISEQIDALKKAGGTSSVFQQFLDKRDKKMKSDVNELVQGAATTQEYSGLSLAEIIKKEEEERKNRGKSK